MNLFFLFLIRYTGTWLKLEIYVYLIIKITTKMVTNHMLCIRKGMKSASIRCNRYNVLGEIGLFPKRKRIWKKLLHIAVDPGLIFLLIFVFIDKRLEICIVDIFII